MIGTITESGVEKSVSVDPAKFVVQPGVEYDYTLVYNNYATNEEKLKLYLGYELISSSADMTIQTVSIIDRKLS